MSPPKKVKNKEYLSKNVQFMVRDLKMNIYVYILREENNKLVSSFKKLIIYLEIIVEVRDESLAMTCDDWPLLKTNSRLDYF